MLNIDKAILLTELNSSKNILEKWIESIHKDGLPKEDFIASEEQAVEWLRRFCGEISLISGKLDALNSSILGER